MALHYPADRYVFAAVLTDDPACVIGDRGLRKYAQSKLPWFDWEKGGCREVDGTLENLQRLEQELGQCIDWVAAPFTFDALIRGATGVIGKCYGGRITTSRCLPNKRQRFCTQACKLHPIFWSCYLRGDGNPVLMQIGFRFDEFQRIERWNCKNDSLDVPLCCDLQGQFKGKHRHTAIEWRIPDFPMARDRVTKQDVVRFWERKGWQWPTVSNCDFCFFHRGPEHRHQALLHPERAQWWIDFEKEVGATFGDRPLWEILDPTQEDLFTPDLEQFACACTD